MGQRNNNKPGPRKRRKPAYSVAVLRQPVKRGKQEEKTVAVSWRKKRPVKLADVLRQNAMKFKAVIRRFIVVLDLLRWRFQRSE